MSRNQFRRRDDVRATGPLLWDTAEELRVTDADYAAMVQRYEDAGDVQNADIIRRQWQVARATSDCKSEVNHAF